MPMFVFNFSSMLTLNGRSLLLFENITYKKIGFDLVLL
jgi:hypothetical protein